MVSKVSNVILRGSIDVTWATLHAVNSIELIDADEFTLHVKIFNGWPSHEAGLLEGAFWRPVKSALKIKIV